MRPPPLRGAAQEVHILAAQLRFELWVVRTEIDEPQSNKKWFICRSPPALTQGKDWQRLSCWAPLQAQGFAMAHFFPESYCGWCYGKVEPNTVYLNSSISILACSDRFLHVVYAIFVTHVNHFLQPKFSEMPDTVFLENIFNVWMCVNVFVLFSAQNQTMNDEIEGAQAGILWNLSL